MKVIFKYPLFHLSDVPGTTEISIPAGARILKVDVQGGQVCVWALVLKGAERVTRTVCVVGTGHPIELDSFSYLETIQDDPFIWHIFIK